MFVSLRSASFSYLGFLPWLQSASETQLFGGSLDNNFPNLYPIPFFSAIVLRAQISEAELGHPAPGIQLSYTATQLLLWWAD